MSDLLLQSYTTDWPLRFIRLRDRLNGVLKDLPVIIHHVGSTAVPGLVAKPIIDIDIEHPEEVTLGQITDRLKELGYVHFGDQGIPGREVFKRSPAASPDDVLDGIRHHLYACRTGNRELLRHLNFRDGLRASTDFCAQYAALKTRVAAETGQNQKAYAALKQTESFDLVEAVIASVL